MAELIIQYVLIVFLVLGIGYFIYFLKEKGVIRDDDYYGITYTILAELENREASPENVKRILRAVKDSVEFVENMYSEDDNKTKEEKAVALAREAIRELKVESPIGDRSLRYMIRLASVLSDGSYKSE